MTVDKWANASSPTTLKVREKSLRYSKIKTKQTKQRELSVEQTIAKLQEEFVNINTDDRAWEDYWISH